MEKNRLPISQDRKPLHTLLPLKTPLTLYIDPSTICNFSCAFCYNNTEYKKQVDAKIMKWELFEKIVNDLKEFDDKIKMIHMYGYGEPLLNKNFAKMVKILKEANVAEKIGVTTNASLLNNDVSKAIIEAGIDKIEISIYGLTNDKYKEFSHQSIDFNQLVTNITYLYENSKNCKIHIKINGDFFSEEEKTLFVNTFENICDSYHIDQAANIWPGIDLSSQIKNADQRVYDDITETPTICPDIFYKLMINSNGRVTVCCVDYLQKVFVGDVKEKSLKEIWNSDKLKNLRLAHLKKDLANYPVCAICKYPLLAATVSIDKYKDELLKEYEG